MCCPVRRWEDYTVCATVIASEWNERSNLPVDGSQLSNRIIHLSGDCFVAASRLLAMPGVICGKILPVVFLRPAKCGTVLLSNEGTMIEPENSPESNESQGTEVSQEEVRDVHAGSVRMNQAAAETISASDIQMEMSAAAAVKATNVSAHQSALAAVEA